MGVEYPKGNRLHVVSKRLYFFIFNNHGLRQNIRKVCMFMKNTSKKELLKSSKLLGSIAALAVAVVIGGTAFFQNANKIVPEFPEITDPIYETSIPEEEPPLASAPKVTTKTTTKTTKKNVKLSKAATKTYTAKLPTTKKTTTKKTTSSKSTVTTQTTVTTAVTEKYTKKSKTKTVTTKVTTTVKTTTVEKATPTPAPKSYTKYTTTVDQLAPKMNDNVINAYNTLNFKVIIDPDVSYSGYFDARSQSITLNAKQMDMFSDTIYHELGHFVAFIAGNVDTKADFVSIYNTEKAKFTGVNKAYASQSSSEFFAECVRVYILDPNTLKSNCPKTYASIENALKAITDARVAAIKKAYAAFWTY